MSGDSPGCFEEGECTESLMLDFTMGIENVQACLELCQVDSECEYFTYYKDDDETCMTFANCETFSTDSCNNCYSGSSTCEG